MTSIDCPICGKSAKFDRTQDVNAVWELHYAEECSQVAAKKKVVKTCAKPGCRTVLGVSNGYNWSVFVELVVFPRHTDSMS